ncbi:hypothetical protein PRIC1_011811 [Phytophthora ramorum]
MRLGRVVLATSVALLATCGSITATTPETARMLLSFGDDQVGEHETIKNSSVEEERMVGISGAAAGARTGGDTYMDEEPSLWEKFKAWWKGDSENDETRRLRQ